MTYVEGFVAAVPVANKDKYIRHAADAAKVFKELGVVRFVETWGDDVPDGKVTDFKGAVKAEPDEAIVFSWFEYPDKATRDATNQKMMADPRMEQMGADMPFDGKRMIYAGFAPIIETGEIGRMGYVDGSLLAVSSEAKDAYREVAERQAAIIMEHGASRIVDAWGDDVPDGKVTDFKGAVKAKPGEVVVYSWVEWPSKEARDRGWEAVFADPRMHEDESVYDGQRRVHGGFRPIVDV